MLVGELFPLEYRGIGSSIATSFSYFCAFLGVKTFIDFEVIIFLTVYFKKWPLAKHLKERATSNNILYTVIL